MRWERIYENTGVIETRHALIPTYHLSQREMVLVDSGAHRSATLLAELEQRGLRVAAVICTHLHPDHIANNRELAALHGAEIFATQFEIDGARARFGRLKATDPGHIWADLGPDYPITPLTEEGVTLGEAHFSVVATPGHTLGHVSVITPDNICCLGDALMSGDQIARAKLPYMDDVDLAMGSLEKLRQVRCPRYLAAHWGVIDEKDVEGVINANIQKELDLYDLLRRTLSRPMGREEAVDAFMAAAGITGREMTVNTFMRYTASTRVEALIHAGEFRLEDGMVIPENYHR